MTQKPLPLSDALVRAVKRIQEMFTDAGIQSNLLPPCPEDATVESLWAQITEMHEQLVALQEEVHALKKLKRGVKPKVENAVKLILEDPELVEVPIDMVAEIICKVFTTYNIECKCSAKSVRWYMSQRNLEWNIQKRRLPKLTQEVNVDEPN